MKMDIYDITGKKSKSIEAPFFFESPVREDVVAKVLESKKKGQPYSSSPVAGKQSSASGIIIHQRKVWKSGYGKGMSRIPRKIMSRRGSQFHWEGADVPSAVGGRRAHPPKAKINTNKINKKEMRIALISALSASADSKRILKKYERLSDNKIIVPIIIESKITSLKVKELQSSLEKILGKNLFKLAFPVKSIRSGRGKLRGRKYKKNAGMLFVLGNEEKLRTKRLDIVTAQTLSVTDLAKGGLGRFVIYTENAINDLQKKLNFSEGTNKNLEKSKK